MLPNTENSWTALEASSQAPVALPDEVLAKILHIVEDVTLFDEERFAARAEARDFLELHLPSTDHDAESTVTSSRRITSLQDRALVVKRQFELVDERLFFRLRESIRAGSCRGRVLTSRLQALALPSAAIVPMGSSGYDSLALLVASLFAQGPWPAETVAREGGMVFYQPTPARVVLRLIGQAALRDHDIFFDLGSGLGHVPILANLISGAKAVGVEIEPAYNEYARRSAMALNASDVVFIDADARCVDYSSGTVFFLYTPFAGRLFEQMLARLEADTRGRTITLFTYGPCTTQTSLQPWLRPARPVPLTEHELAVFSRIPAAPDFD